jgi:hypothetical protein
MITRRLVVLGVLCAALAGSVPVAGQQVIVRTATLFESYTFDAGLPFTSVSEFTVPVTITYQLGRFGNIAVSSGYASVGLNSSDTDQLPNQTLSGLLDTEARLTVNVIPGRLVALFTGAIPTGVGTVAFEELSVLGAISSDVIGFSTNDFGTGGNVGGGFAGAVPLGRMAVGFGGTFRRPISYSPVSGQPQNLRPGSEFRLRTGIQGPLARRTYVRVAAIYAQRQKDQIDGVVQNGVGNRFTGYLAVDQGIGSKQLSIYAFDVFRANPQIEQTAVGAAFLPRGNLFGIGGEFSIPVGFTMNVVPRFEYRHSVAAPDTVNTSIGDFEKLGSSVRVGVEVRARATQRLAVVFHADGLTGSARQSGSDIGIQGFRVAIHLEVTR